MTKRPLYLHEEVLLLGLNDEKGTPERGAWLQPALGGAVIGELFHAARIRNVKDGKREVVEVVSGEPLGNSLLDDYLALIEDSKRTQPAKFWASSFSTRGDLFQRTAEGLCELGVLRTDERKVLFVFTRKSYPEIESSYETELVERLRAAIFGDAELIDPRTQMIVAIAKQTGLLNVHFKKRELDAHKERIEAVANGDYAGAATQGAVEAAHTAFFLTSMVPLMLVHTH